MAAGRRQLFVYWHVEPAALDLAITALRAVQQRLRTEHPGLISQIFQRTDAAAAATIMETYALDAAQSVDGIDDGLCLAISAAADGATARWRQGARHEERFDLCK